jgi:hypothetical protein
MRFVALAETGSSPIIIRMGKDTAEPADAAVLRKPQVIQRRTPAAKTRRRIPSPTRSSPVS